MQCRNECEALLDSVGSSKTAAFKPNTGKICVSLYDGFYRLSTYMRIYRQLSSKATMSQIIPAHLCKASSSIGRLSMYLIIFARCTTGASLKPGSRIVLRGQKPLALRDRCSCFGSLFPPLAALTFAASSIICAFGLASAVPRSPYRHLELCGIALAFEQCIYFSACFSSYKKFSASMGVRVSISRLFSLSTTSLGTAGLL